MGSHRAKTARPRSHTETSAHPRSHTETSARPRKRTRPARRQAAIGALTLPLLAAALSVPLAGCGSSQEDITAKPPAAILAASANAARQAGSVVVVNRSKVGNLSTGFELRLAGEEDGTARTSLGPSDSEVIRAGGTVYVKASPVLAERLAKTTGAHIPVGSWLQAPASNPQVAPSAFLTKPDGELVFLLHDPNLALIKGPVVTIKGKKAIELKTRGKLYTGAIYIAATGTPYPITIVKHGQENSTITFTGWNQPIHLSPPPKATSISQLEHAKGG